MLLAQLSSTYSTFHYLHSCYFPLLSLTLTTAVAPVFLFPPMPIPVIFTSADRVLLIKHQTLHVRILPSHLYKGQTLTMTSRSYVSAPHHPFKTSDPIYCSYPHPPSMPATTLPHQAHSCIRPWHLLTPPAWPVLSPCCTQLALYLLQVIN